MKFTLRIDQARELATKLHEGQFRKNGKTPYITHLLEVASILSDYTDDEEVIMAGLMHDTIEDVPNYTYERLVADCGKRVADIVEGVTEEGFPPGFKELPREERVAAFEDMLAKQAQKVERAGAESMLVAVADKIHNLESMIEGVEREGLDYLKVFKMRTDQKLVYYRDILERSKSYVDPELVDRLGRAIAKAEKLFLN